MWKSLIRIVRDAGVATTCAVDYFCILFNAAQIIKVHVLATTSLYGSFILTFTST